MPRRVSRPRLGSGSHPVGTTGSRQAALGPKTRRHPDTRGQVFNLQFVSLGRYRAPWKTAEAKEACRGSMVEHTGLFRQWEVWERLFSEHGEALYDAHPPRTRLDAAAMWHGLKRPGAAFRLDLEASSLRPHRHKGHLPRSVHDSDAETVVLPFDTFSQPFCAVMEG